MGFYGWRPYVSVAQRRRQAARRDGEAQEEGPSGLAGGRRRPHHRQDVLGQGLVREPGALQRLCQPVAARPDLCAQRFGDRSSDCARRDQSPGQRLGDLRSCGEGCAGREGALAIHLQGLRRRDRFAHRASAGTVLQGCHGTRLPAEDRPFPVARTRSSSRAVVRTGPRCASMSRRCSTASAHGLDQQPDLLFRLHDVDEKELIAGAGKALPLARKAPAAGKVLGGEDLSALFGLDMAADASPAKPKRQKVEARKRTPAVPDAKGRVRLLGGNGTGRESRIAKKN